jgi:hypothetical protein
MRRPESHSSCICIDASYHTIRGEASATSATNTPRYMGEPTAHVAVIVVSCDNLTSDNVRHRANNTNVGKSELTLCVIGRQRQLKILRYDIKYYGWIAHLVAVGRISHQLRASPPPTVVCLCVCEVLSASLLSSEARTSQANRWSMVDGDGIRSAVVRCVEMLSSADTEDKGWWR